MARGKAHSDETRAQVMAALLAGQSVTQVARDYKIDRSLVSRWKTTIPADKLHEVATKKEEDFGALVGNYLREILTTLSVQAEHCRDKTWLNKQSAESVAVNHGVLADKAFRILEAAERAAGCEAD